MKIDERKTKYSLKEIMQRVKETENKKSKECKLLGIKYKRAKPTTKQWHNKCKALQGAFEIWFDTQIKDNAKSDKSHSTKSRVEGKK